MKFSQEFNEMQENTAKPSWIRNIFILEYEQLWCSVTIISYFSNSYLTHNVFNVLTLYFRVMLYISLDSQGNFT